MKKYRNLHGDSGVAAFETGPDFIKIKFRGSCDIYTYSYRSAGIKHIEKMKIFAEHGLGLSSYINRYVRDRYE